MLLPQSQFAKRFTVSTPTYLLNPPINEQENIVLGKGMVLHLLTPGDEVTFPNRNTYYFNEISSSKKLPVQHISDLSSIEGTTTLNNKKLIKNIRDWRVKNLKEFRDSELTESPNSDENVVAIINYNPVKDLYNYRNSPLSEYQEFHNLALTLADYLGRLVKLNKTDIHLVPLEIPLSIPSRMTLTKIMKITDPRKLMRIVTDRKLLWVMELLKWFSNELRPGSVFKDITDEDSKRVIIEFKYKKLSLMLPMGVLRSISEESELSSTSKVSSTRIDILFLFLLRKLQETADVPQEESDTVEEESNLNLSNDPDKEESDYSNLEEDKQKEVLKVKKMLDFSDKEEEDVLFSDDSEEYEIEDEPEALIDTYFLRRLNEVENSPEEGPDETESEEDLELKEIPLVSDEELESLTTTIDTETRLNEFLDKAAIDKTMSVSEIRSFRTAQEKRLKLNSPYKDQLLDDYLSEREPDLEMDEEMIGIKIDSPFLSEDMKSDKMAKFDEVYVEKMLEKDMVASVMNLENSDIIITNYEKELTQTAVDKYETHKVTIKPFKGKDTTVYFRVPVIDSEGTFMVSGTKYRMRKLRQPLPLVKVSDIRVALTSNYGKFFISRTERKANNRGDYLVDFIRKDYLGDRTKISSLIPGKKNLSKVNLPNDFHILKSNFNELTVGDYTLFMREDDEANHVKPEVSELIKKKGAFFAGSVKGGGVLVIDKQGVFYNLGEDNKPLGTIEDILGIDPERVPKSFSVMKVLGKDIPLGVCLGYYLGLPALLKLTGTEYKVIGPRERHKASSKELVLRFSNYKLVITTDTPEKELIFNGFLFYKDTLKELPLKSFEHRDVYLNLVAQRGQGLIHLKELDTLRELFVDPITAGVLEKMKEPKEYIPLLIRANELLKDYTYPDPNDPKYVRIRGYDRIPGLMYRALAESIREHKIKGRNNAKLSVDPYKVWNFITQDSSVKSRDKLNPLLTLKENESLTLTGLDGLSSGAVPANLRRYHANDAGLVSEASVDSKDVGVSSYLSPYAKIDGLRGMVDTDNAEAVDNPAKIFSSPTQLAPLVDTDDMKRINFVNNQASHLIPSEGYRQSNIRTTYEYVVPYKVGNEFVVVAKEDGVVTEVTDNLLTVTYKSGEVKGFNIGGTYGTMEGSTYLHELICDLKKGAKFSSGDILAFHKDFFERDWLNKSSVVSKTSTLAKVAIMVNNETFEDSSAVSSKFAKRLSTTVLEERVFTLDFKQNITQVLPIGSEVNPQDVLFIALDETDGGDNLSEQTLTMLQQLSSLAPRAKVKGVIDRLEVKYNGEVNDMSPSLKKLVTEINKQTYKRTKGTDYESKDNKVSIEYRSGGANLQLDTLELKVFIKMDLGLGIGDKLVFGNQMKSVIGEVYSGTITSAESGEEIDAQFSMTGILNRIVHSAFVMGTSSRLIRHVNKQIADVYFKK